MPEKKVKEIMLPFQDDTALEPFVVLEDSLIHAIEVMVNENLNRVVVLRRNYPVGIVRLEDAFHELGMRGRSSGKAAPKPPAGIC